VCGAGNFFASRTVPDLPACFSLRGGRREVQRLKSQLKQSSGNKAHAARRYARRGRASNDILPFYEQVQRDREGRREGGRERGRKREDVAEYVGEM